MAEQPLLVDRAGPERGGPRDPVLVTPSAKDRILVILLPKSVKFPRLASLGFGCQVPKMLVILLPKSVKFPRLASLGFGCQQVPNFSHFNA